MSRDLIISFPHMGNYHIPISAFLQRLFPEARIMPPPPITRQTAAMGARHSPDFICEPFEYNMGNFIQALDRGANLLFQTGMGCRYGYYGELQEQILRDLGYKFQFLCLSRERARPLAAYKSLRKLGSPLNFAQMVYTLLLTAEEIKSMEKLEKNTRESTKKSKNPLRVGIVGDLYTVMEPFSNFDLERKLAARDIAVSRQMSVSFLLFGESEEVRLRKTHGYLRHSGGANGLDSVAQSLAYARLGYDGVIHAKSFGCTPELNAMPAMMRLSEDLGIPILHLSFDTHSSETGLDTRLEAFIDMMEMRRNTSGKSIQSGGRRGLHLHKGHHSG